jgi:hypothetical protein
VKKKYNIDKKQFVIEIITELFNGNLNPNDVANTASACQFLFDNLLIRAVPVADRLKYYAWNWIKRKLI